MIKTLSIDLETRSGADIGKTGVYRYAEDPEFDILLFGVSINGGPVTVYDLASGDVVPQEIIEALRDETVIKYAYNASFERICLSYWMWKKDIEHTIPNATIKTICITISSICAIGHKMIPTIRMIMSISRLIYFYTICCIPVPKTDFGWVGGIW